MDQSQASQAPASTRVALIGCGRWGRNIAKVLARLGALEVIVDPAADALRPLAEELGVTVSDDLDRAFGAGIDAVAIAAPAIDHARLIEQALANGKHVFVEKPLALDIADAERVAADAARRGLTLMVGHLLQYHPAFVRLKEMVAAGAIGGLRHIASNRLNPGAVRTEEDALWSMAPHDFSMILSLTQMSPVTVSSLPVRVINPKVPDQFAVQLRFSEQLTAQANVSWISPFKEHKLVVLGESGAIVFEDTAADPARKLVIYRDYVDATGPAPRFVKSEGELVDYPRTEPLEQEMRHFLDCVVGGGSPRTGPGEAIAVLQLLHRAGVGADPDRQEA
jgi:UDP-2-acetamido-3-amino-2,3-dideoxy-glucuronate N-acetyltransferase